MSTSARSRLFKVVLIPILTIALVWRIVNMTGLPEATGALSSVLEDSSTAETPSKAKILAKEVLSGINVEWPKRSLSEILSHDPFSTSQTVPDVIAEDILKSESDAAAETETESPEFDLKAIYQSKHGTVALIGDRIVRPGDRLPNGALVVEILAHEIVVEPARIDE